MKTTKEVAQELNIKPAALRQHIASGNIAKPKRRAGMLFLWTLKEIKVARQVLSQPGRRQSRYVVQALSKGVHNE
ncbi:MAG: hypothetical protein GY774_03820 [Planctomycetes bacterium]|nr:hypothetical protein [Planctomycetota bacterium]